MMRMTCRDRPRTDSLIGTWSEGREHHCALIIVTPVLASFNPEIRAAEWLSQLPREPSTDYG